MQFIEKNSFNVRSAVYHLKKDHSPLEYVIFPMIHVGSAEFYKEVSQRLASCDLILAEGVKSRRVDMLTRSYRIVKYIRRMDLVTQQDGMDIESLRSKMLNADMESSVFDERWSTLPIQIRLQLLVLVPIFATYLFFSGTRETLAENLALDDFPTNEELINYDEDFEPLDSLIIQERDWTLIDHIRKLESQENVPKRVGILYGARHMRNTMSFLMQKLNYHIAKAEWVKVFDL
jgi:hypothetical protein